MFVVNEKFVSADRPWRVFEESSENFPTLFTRVRALTLDEDAPLGMRENAALLHFLIRCFQSVVRRAGLQRAVAVEKGVSCSAD